MFDLEEAKKGIAESLFLSLCHEFPNEFGGRLVKVANSQMDSVLSYLASKGVCVKVYKSFCDSCNLKEPSLCSICNSKYNIEQTVPLSELMKEQVKS